jgi:hypothetical protein
LIEIREKKVLAQLGDKKEHEAQACTLDIRATNHMCKFRAMFMKLDSTMISIV